MTPQFTTMTRTCLRCELPFKSHSFSADICGASFNLVQSHCDPCVEVEDGKMRDRTKGVSLTPKKPWSEICPPAYQDFDPAKLPPAGFAITEKVFSWKKSQKGIGLIGVSRSGKSFILHELMRRWYECGVSVHMPTATGFALACGSPNGGERIAMINRCIQADLLFIDDLGKEKLTERVESDLFHVLEERRRYLKPVFIDVNSTGEQLRKRMSEDAGTPIINRLKYDLCDFLVVE